MIFAASHASLFRIPDDVRSKYRALVAKNMEGAVDSALYNDLPGQVRENPLNLLLLAESHTVRDVRNVTSRVQIESNTFKIDLWVKVFRPRSVVEWIQYAFRPGKAVHAWNASFWLRMEGIGTPRPLIGLRKRGHVGGAEGLLAVEHVKDSVELRELLDGNGLTQEQRVELIHSLARFLRKFHSSGFRHRDLRRANILVRRLPNHGFDFYMIDLNRMRRYTTLTMPQRLRELERLSLDDNDMTAFFHTYISDSLEARSVERAYRERLAFYKRLEKLPSPLNRLTKKLWYYFQELRVYGLSRRELLPR